jgi:biotin carboxyl carrier protein
MIEIKSEMAATVCSIHVTPGDAVRSGDTLIILESMKMEIPVQSTTDGTVAAVLVEHGETVANGSILVVLRD